MPQFRRFHLRPTSGKAGQIPKTGCKEGIPPRPAGRASVRRRRDVSYCNPEEGVAAYALVETATGELVWSMTIRRAGPLSVYHVLLDVPRAAAAGRVDRRGPRTKAIGRGRIGGRNRRAASTPRRHRQPLGSGRGNADDWCQRKKLLCGQVDIRGLQQLESRPV